MFWQDYVITFGTILFIVALIPSVLSKDKPALSTSILTGSVLGTFVIVYFSLGLTFAAFTNAMTSFLWFVLAFQKYQVEYTKQKPKPARKLRR